MVSSASSHNCLSVSCALAPLSNSLRIRSRWASHCGPSTDNGVTESSIFVIGRLLGFRPVLAAAIDLRVSFLAPVSTHFKHRHAWNSYFRQCLPDGFEP